MNEHLTVLECEVIAFEQGWFKHPAVRESLIRERFGWSHTRHVLVLNAAIEHPAAPAYAPTLVRTLRERRAARIAARPSLRTGGPR